MKSAGKLQAIELSDSGISDRLPPIGPTYSLSGGTIKHWAKKMDEEIPWKEKSGFFFKDTSST